MEPSTRPWLRFDHEVTARIATWYERRWVRWLATITAHTGDSILWLAAGALAWRFGIGFWARVGERALFATVATWVVSTCLKFFFQRPRPEGAQGLFYLDVDRHSFPSGHATRVGGLLVAVGSLLPWWGGLTMAVWGISVCLSRVALKLHYVGDVVIGALVGAAVGTLLLFVLR